MMQMLNNLPIMHSPKLGFIAILLPDLRGGGAERVSLDLAYEFRRRGYDVEFVLMRAKGDFLPEARAAFSVVDLQCSRGRGLPLAVARYLRRHRPAGLIVAMWPLTVLAGVGRLLAGSGCRLLVSEHGMLSLQYRNWGRFHSLMLRLSVMLGYRLADARVAVSGGLARDMANLAALRLCRIKVIHNPIPVRVDPTPMRVSEVEALWGGTKGARILNVGSFKKVKNHPLLLKAFARLPETLNGRLLLLGMGEGEAELRMLAIELGVSERVTFAGFHTDPTPFYRTADLFVLSSDNEGLPTVLLEALSAGIPVVSTDCPSGPREILEDGRYGKLVPVGDAHALAHAIVATLAEPVDREALQARARRFAPEPIADAYLRLLFPDEASATA